MHEPLDARRLVGHAPADDFEEGDAEGVDIHPPIDVSSEELLRSHVRRCPHHVARARDALVLDGPGEAEVGDLHMSRRGDEEVAGLHVAMEDPRFVSGVKRVGRVHHERDEGAKATSR